MDAKQLALVISELLDGDVRVLTLPSGDGSFSDVIVESLDGKQVFCISVIDFSQAIVEAK